VQTPGTITLFRNYGIEIVVIDETTLKTRCTRCGATLTSEPHEQGKAKSYQQIQHYISEVWPHVVAHVARCAGESKEQGELFPEVR
jgi:hypothetical protein